MNKGVAGHVASTGKLLNITDAYSDDRFNRCATATAQSEPDTRDVVMVSGKLI